MWQRIFVTRGDYLYLHWRGLLKAALAQRPQEPGIQSRVLKRHALNMRAC
jgi:hypothetical protein